MDKNYWKEAYKEYWEISSKKEIFVKELIESKTGFKTLEVGLGAGSEDFLSGSASDYGLTKGDADLYVLNSSYKCNGIHINNLFKFFVWCEVSKSFTRSII